MRSAVAAACVVLAAAACEGSNLFSGQVGGGSLGGGATGSGAVQGSVLVGGTGLGGVSVVLVGRDSTQTDAGGVFLFDSIPPATYQITVLAPLGYTPAAGQTSTRSVTVTSGGTTGVTFVLQRTGTVP